MGEREGDDCDDWVCGIWGVVKVGWMNFWGVVGIWLYVGADVAAVVSWVAAAAAAGADDDAKDVVFAEPDMSKDWSN